MRYIVSSFLCLFFLSIFGIVKAADVDTVLTHSKVMKKDIKAVVITPAEYKKGKAFPVVYLLHGWSNNYGSWVNNCKELTQFADHYRMIFVCPDGGYSSWYFDSPVDQSFKYETYITKELLAFVDSKYKTIASREGRSITGYSMGGHGAFYLTMRHQDLFGAMGSLSGGLDIRPFPNNWDIASRLGSYPEQPANWEQHTIMNMLPLLTGKQLPAIIFDCGKSDFFYPCNVALHERMEYLNIPHDFISRPGNHNWAYWSSAIGYQILFFSQHMKAAMLN